MFLCFDPVFLLIVFVRAVGLGSWVVDILETFLFVLFHGLLCWFIFWSLEWGFDSISNFMESSRSTSSRRASYWGDSPSLSAQCVCVCVKLDVFCISTWITNYLYHRSFILQLHSTSDLCPYHSSWPMFWFLVSQEIWLPAFWHPCTRYPSMSIWHTHTKYPKYICSTPNSLEKSVVLF